MARIKFYCKEFRGNTLFQVLEQDIEMGEYQEIHLTENTVLRKLRFPEIVNYTGIIVIFIRGWVIEYDYRIAALPTNIVSASTIIGAFKHKANTFVELPDDEYIAEW